MSDELREAAERRRKPYPRASVSGGKDYDSYYVHQQEWADLNKLADAFCDEHPSDDDTPIDDEWLLSCGWKRWDERDDVYSGELYCTFGEWLGWETRLTFHIGCIEAVRMTNSDELSGVSAEAVILLGEPCSKSKRVTRGQLRRLCSALGIELKEGK